MPMTLRKRAVQVRRDLLSKSWEAKEEEIVDNKEVLVFHPLLLLLLLLSMLMMKMLVM